MGDKDVMTVATVDTTVTRGGLNLRELKLDQLASSMSTFLGQISHILDQTPDRLGQFEFETLEVTAQISGKGQFVLLGVGGEAGATGGIKMTFKRSREPQ